MLENKLAWAPGSIDTILGGGEPNELVATLHQSNPITPAQAYALRPTTPNALSQVPTEELLLELRRRIIAPRDTRTTPGTAGRRPRPARRLARRGLAASCPDVEVGCAGGSSWPRW